MMVGFSRMMPGARSSLFVKLTRLLFVISQTMRQSVWLICQGNFRDLVRGALLTGCRYGELCRMRVSDYNSEAQVVTIRESKSGKVRHVAITDEGSALFQTVTTGKTGKDLIFTRDDGGAWKASRQQRPLEVASHRAKIEPAVTFHTPAYLCKYACYESCSDGRHRRPTWPCGHADD